MKKRLLKIIAIIFYPSFIFCIIFSLMGCRENHDENIRTFIDNLPEEVKENILWFCDYEDGNFSKWEDYKTDNDYSGGGIFLTDPENSIYGIEQTVVYSGKKSAFTTIKNATIPGLKKAIRLIRWTDKPWDKGGNYFPNESYYSTFFL